MQIQEKQYNLLIRLLKGYVLHKNLEDLTKFEVSIIIEGMLNNGIVKNTFNGKVLSDEEYARKQAFFDRLVSKKSIYASDKQLIYIENLLMPTKYILATREIPKNDVNTIIMFLTNKVENPDVFKYIRQITSDDLIKVKEINPIEKPKLPEDWIMQDIEINGIINFKK